MGESWEQPGPQLGSLVISLRASEGCEQRLRGASCGDNNYHCPPSSPSSFSITIVTIQRQPQQQTKHSFRENFLSVRRGTKSLVLFTLTPIPTPQDRCHFPVSNKAKKAGRGHAAGQPGQPGQTFTHSIMLPATLMGEESEEFGHLAPGGPWVCHFTSAGLCFPIYKMRLLMAV